MVAKKHASKRQTLRAKYKIVRKVREYKRKLKRKGIKDPNAPRKSRRDPGIPADAPFKDAIMADLEREKQQLAEEREVQKQATKESQKRAKEQAERRAMEEAARANSLVDPAQEGSLRVHRLLKSTLESCDVVLEVLDARDPLGSRCYALEQQLTVGKMAKHAGAAKPIILVLNKCDTVPVSVVQAWIEFFERDYPVVAFYANPEIRQQEIAGMFVKPEQCCAGMSALVELLCHYEKSADAANSATLNVAVIGYANTGKSSVINTLTRTKVVGVSRNAGFTKDVRKIRLKGVDASKQGRFKNIWLHDTPAVPATARDVGPHTVLPIEPAEPMVEHIVSNIDPEVLCRAFCIPEFDDFNDFLTQLATKNALFKKGAKPRLHTAARDLLKDWNAGKVYFLTLPPVSEQQEDEPATNSAISQLFDAANDATLEALSKRKLPVPEDSFLVLNDSLLGSGMMDEDEDGDAQDMEDEDDSDAELMEDDEAEDADELAEDDEQSMEEEEEEPEPVPVKGKRKQAAPAAPVVASAKQQKAPVKQAAASPAAKTNAHTNKAAEPTAAANKSKQPHKNAAAASKATPASPAAPAAKAKQSNSKAQSTPAAAPAASKKSKQSRAAAVPADSDEAYDFAAFQ